MSRRDLLVYLGDFGWRDVDTAGPSAAHASAAPAAQAGGGDPLAAGDLAEMGRRLAGCTRCRLCQGRTQVVFGVGNPDARVVFVGEGPGADEDRIGEPFVGRAGQLLNVMLPSIGLRRDDVYIANIVKCRPPGNRDPEPDEVATCGPFVRRQLEILSPRVIVALGRPSAHFLLDTVEPITALRGKFRDLGSTRVMPTFHPAYLLRNESAKRPVWEDMKLVRDALGLTGGPSR